MGGPITTDNLYSIIQVVYKKEKVSIMLLLSIWNFEWSWPSNRITRVCTLMYMHLYILVGVRGTACSVCKEDSTNLFYWTGIVILGVQNVVVAYMCCVCCLYCSTNINKIFLKNLSYNLLKCVYDVIIIMYTRVNAVIF